MGLWVVEVVSTAPTWRGSTCTSFLYVIRVAVIISTHRWLLKFAAAAGAGVDGWCGACQRRARLLLHAFKRELSIPPNRITHGKNNDVHSVHTWWL